MTEPQQQTPPSNAQILDELLADEQACAKSILDMLETYGLVSEETLEKNRRMRMVVEDEDVAEALKITKEVAPAFIQLEDQEKDGVAAGTKPMTPRMKREFVVSKGLFRNQRERAAVLLMKLTLQASQTATKRSNNQTLPPAAPTNPAIGHQPYFGYPQPPEQTTEGEYDGR